jgi:hypothetical protein
MNFIVGAGISRSLLIEDAKIPRRKNSSVGFVRLFKIRLNDIFLELDAKFLKNRKQSYEYY